MRLPKIIFSYIVIKLSVGFSSGLTVYFENMILAVKCSNKKRNFSFLKSQYFWNNYLKKIMNTNLYLFFLYWKMKKVCKKHCFRRLVKFYIWVKLIFFHFPKLHLKTNILQRNFIHKNWLNIFSYCKWKNPKKYL